MLIRRGDQFTTTAPTMVEAAALGLLYTDGQLPGGRVWKMTGQNSRAFIGGTVYEIAPGVDGLFTPPSSAGAISVTRDAADNAKTIVVVVEYLDSDFYHRSAVFPFAGGGGDTASTDIEGKTINAWRVLDAVWVDTSVNAGACSVAIANAGTQAIIGAGDGISFGGRWTVPRGQKLAITGYRATCDATKIAKFNVRGSVIDVADGTRLEIKVEAVAETDSQIGEQFTMRPVGGTNPDGVWQTGAVDLWVETVFANNTTAQVDTNLQGLLLIDERHPDPHPELIPWVAARIKADQAA